MDRESILSWSEYYAKVRELDDLKIKLILDPMNDVEEEATKLRGYLDDFLDRTLSL